MYFWVNYLIKSLAMDRSVVSKRKSQEHEHPSTNQATNVPKRSVSKAQATRPCVTLFDKFGATL